jgi:hypothetical protein
VLLERRIMLQELRNGCMLRRMGRGGKSLPYTRHGEPCEDRNHDDVAVSDRIQIELVVDRVVMLSLCRRLFTSSCEQY